MMKSASILVATVALSMAVLGGSSAWGNAKTPVTFTKDVLPILQENCQTCHRPSGANLSGMIAPMSLMTYGEVRPWAKSIAQSVVARSMPPWTASPAYHGVFKNERSLTQEEIDTIVAWVGNRAPRGNPNDAPAPMHFSETGWNFGEPDLIVGFEQPFFVEDDVEDLYHNVMVQLTEEQLPEDRWISELEFRPGSEVVHHIIGYAAAPGEEAEAAAREGQQTRGMLGGMAPGTEEANWPEGFGILLPEDSTLTFAMHYHKEAGAGTGTWDLSEIGFKFHDAPAKHPIEISTIAYGAFEVPPGASNWRVGASRTFEEDTILVSMMPHMHLRGKAAKYTAYYPDGTVEELLDVPAYDFNWQTQYDLAMNKLLPAGTRIEMDFRYDNSGENAERVGFDPSRAVAFGGPTTDEMDLAWVTIAPAKPLD